MTPGYYTKKTFEKIKSVKKEYYGFEGAHFPTDMQTYERWADCVDNFIKKIEQ